MNIQEGHLSRHGGSPDYLTCGDCAREFLLENITLFIAHKTWGCTEKARARRREGPSDIGEDTSSPLTCSACSRVFMTARGLLHHVQCEHGMTICLRKGPLIISDKRLPASEVTSSPDLESKHKLLRSPSMPVPSPQQSIIEQPLAPEHSSPRQECNPQARAGVISVSAENVDEPVKQEGVKGVPREGFDHETDAEPKNLSQRSRSTAKSDRNRYSSEERPSSCRLNDQVQSGNQGTNQETSRSSSVPKKRRYTLPAQGEDCDQEVKDMSHAGSSHTEADYSIRATSSERLSRRNEFTQDDKVCGSEGERLVYDKNSRNLCINESNVIDTGQYYSESRKRESPICLVMDNVSDVHGTEAEKAKNIILKKLLLRNSSSESSKYSSLQEVHISPPNLLGMPKLEIDTRSLVRNFFDTHYTEASNSARSTAITMSTTVDKQQEQQCYQRAPYPSYITESSIEQSIDQIIRASVSKEIEDLSISNDSIERSPPLRPPSSPCYPGSHMLQGSTSSYQGIPMTMPSLIASRQIGYFSPQPFPTAGSRRGSVGPLPYPISTGSTATSPGSMSAPDKALDTTNVLETGGLYPVVHDGSSLPHFSMGYHHKMGIDRLRRGATDYKGTHGAGTNPLYCEDVDIQHWTTMAGDPYVGSMPSRIPPEKQSAEGRGMSSEFDDSKALIDGRMKKRRYPTSRPFKCAHCDQAFNQRIHLKKHMSKHTGVKPFKCQQCDYSTVERSHLKVHYRIHTGEKPYRCMFCDYATAQNSTLKIHLKRHHEGQQAATKDAKASRCGRRDNQKVSAEIMHGDIKPSDLSKIRENFEVGQHHGQGYHGTVSGTNTSHIAAEQDEQSRELGAKYFNTSRSQRQDPRDIEKDTTARFQTYRNCQVNNVQSSGSPVMIPGADNIGNISQNVTEERRQSSIWRDIPEAHQRGQQQRREKISSVGDLMLSLDVTHKMSISAEKPGENLEVGDSDPLNFSSSNSSWEGQKQYGESGKDLTKQTSKKSETKEVVKEYTEMNRAPGTHRTLQQEADTAAAVKPEANKDDFSDDEMEHVDYEAVKLIVIPDKAFVRG